MLAAVLPSRRRQTLFWGPEPIVTYRDFSAAVKQLGYKSVTLMAGVYKINKGSDYDFYYKDFAWKRFPESIRFVLGSCLALVYVLRRGKVVHMPFRGFVLGTSPFWRMERTLFRLAGIKTVILPYGGDSYLYSLLHDTTLRYGLLASYPGLALTEHKTSRKVKFWTRHGDAVATSFMMDGMGRWDVTLPELYIVDTGKWRLKTSYSDADGTNGTVRVLHSPNHRGVKGTEFIIHAVNQLRAEGLDIELVLLEGVPNDQINVVMQDVDILAEQLVLIAYGINALEAMASGLPVLANLSSEFYTRVFRRYSYLNFCPVLSTTHETITENLRLLVKSPKLRRELGMAGRSYVERYHSLESAKYMFGSIYKRIIGNEDIDLINLFHPLLSDYVRRPMAHTNPLHENKLPVGWTEEQFAEPDQPG